MTDQRRIGSNVPTDRKLRPDAAKVPRLPHTGPGPAQGAWQRRPNPFRLTRCASFQNPPLADSIVRRRGKESERLDRLDAALD
jgi:hypothetical protein